MKIIRCKISRRDKQEISTGYGVIEDEHVNLLKDEPYTGLVFSGKKLPLKDVKLLPPCLPSKIVAIGINYTPHARELDFAIPSEPLLFLKPPSAVIGPNEDIILPEMSARVEFEGELAAVIGRIAKNVSEESALDHVLGYTCFNDVTARDLQQKDIQFTRSKSFDTFAAMGPVIETDLNPNALELRTTLNGEVRQKANTSTLIRKVPELISFSSRIMTLLPGDIIATGTPSGVGGLDEDDIISIHISGIGTLTNTVRHNQHPG